MKKFINFKTTIILTIFFLIISAVKVIGTTSSVYKHNTFALYSRDGSDEDEKEEEEDDDDEYQSEQNTDTQTTDVPAAVPVTKVTTVVYDAGFNVDTDKDGLVDAIDPHPNIDERMLFTDDDNDSVANYYDLFPNENDYLYMDFEDANQNGVFDSFEQ